MMNPPTLTDSAADRMMQAIDRKAGLVLRYRWAVYYAVVLAYGLMMAAVLRTGGRLTLENQPTPLPAQAAADHPPAGAIAQ